MENTWRDRLKDLSPEQFARFVRVAGPDPDVVNSPDDLLSWYGRTGQLAILEGILTLFIAGRRIDFWCKTEQQADASASHVIRESNPRVEYLNLRPDYPWNVTVDLGLW